MSVPLEFRPGVARAARAVYRQSDFALRYSLEPQVGAQEGHGLSGDLDARLGVRRPQWLAIADTLVLAFSGADADLVAFDAYTNHALWRRTPSLDVPEVLGTGTLHLASPPRDTDRIDLGIVPHYEYVEAEARLRITFGRPGIHHYRVSSCLVVGTDANGIATLDIGELEIRE